MMGWAAAGAHCGAKGSQLSQLISQSGSFAASGLVAAAACYSSPTAHAWTVPLTARLSDPGLPPRVAPRPIRGSGKLVQRLNSWDSVVVQALPGRDFQWARNSKWIVFGSVVVSIADVCGASFQWAAYCKLHLLHAS